MKRLLIILFVLTSTIIISCSQADKKKKENLIESGENKRKEIIQIQFIPSFLSPSQLICDLNNKRILLQRIGGKNKLKALPPEGTGEIVEVFSPKTSYFKIDSINLSIIRDSILNKFTDLDFKDNSIDAHDGIWTSIVVVDGQDSIKDFELENSGTDNQIRLILKLIDVCIENETDSLNAEYLKDLKKYYKLKKISA